MKETGDSDRQERCVALIGLRGAGKSAVGRELAATLGCDWIDTDERVIEKTGKSIAAIFSEEGEAGFRRYEREVIAAISEASTVVISVGGGAVLDSQNVAHLKRIATVVWLMANPEVLCRRLAADPATSQLRPPLTDQSPLDEMRQLLSARAQFYERAADWTIDTQDKTPRQVAELIAARLGRADDSPSG